MRTRVSDRSGDGVVSVVHGPVSQAGLPAADVRRSVSRTWCRDADRRSVSISVAVFADEGLVYWIDSSARHVLSTKFSAAERSIIANLPPGNKLSFIR